MYQTFFAFLFMTSPIHFTTSYCNSLTFGNINLIRNSRLWVISIFRNVNQIKQRLWNKILPVSEAATNNDERDEANEEDDHKCYKAC